MSSPRPNYDLMFHPLALTIHVTKDMKPEEATAELTQIYMQNKEKHSFNAVHEKTGMTLFHVAALAQHQAALDFILNMNKVEKNKIDLDAVDAAGKKAVDYAGKLRCTLPVMAAPKRRTVVIPQAVFSRGKKPLVTSNVVRAPVAPPPVNAAAAAAIKKAL